MNYYDDVRKFNEKFDFPYEPKTPIQTLSLDLLRYRGAFIIEELIEFFQSFSNTGEVVISLAKARKDVLGIQGRTVNGIDADPDCDLEKSADALADMVYVILGTAHMMGLPFDKIWAEVQRANMTKERAKNAKDPKSTRKHAMDCIKPEGWVAPNHRKALGLG